MADNSFTLSPHEAWRPLPQRMWDMEAVRHFLRRTGFYVDEKLLWEIQGRGPLRAFQRLWQKTEKTMPLPAQMEDWEGSHSAHRQAMREAPDPEARQEVDRERNQFRQRVFQNLNLEGLRWVCRPEQQIRENWTHFLQNIFVVAIPAVNDPGMHYRHHQLLREKCEGQLRDLTRAVSRSPAMIEYLDLQRSRRDRPNENFARELFELFLLGEGQYTEQDIREAARAFTGYRQRDGEFWLDQNHVDSGRKTIFNRHGHYTGDQVIDLALRQPAAQTHLPREACRWYLTDLPLPESYLEELGRLWAQSDFSLLRLLEIIVTSTLFYQPAFRGNLIKSPMRLYLGLQGDLRLDVPPFPRPVLNAFRIMGQPLYQPPNVRGWVGGQLWINASTLNARRQLVERLFQPVQENRLNADEQAALREAREGRSVNLYVTLERLEQIAGWESKAITRRFFNFFLAKVPHPDFARSFAGYLDDGPSEERAERLRHATVALLQSPHYQLF